MFLPEIQARGSVQDHKLKIPLMSSIQQRAVILLCHSTKSYRAGHLRKTEDVRARAEVVVPAVEVGVDQAALSHFLELPVRLHYATRPAVQQQVHVRKFAGHNFVSHTTGAAGQTRFNKVAWPERQQRSTKRYAAHFIPGEPDNCDFMLSQVAVEVCKELVLHGRDLRG